MSLYRTISVQPVQLAIAMHEVFPCPFTHNPKHKKYVEPSECPNLQNNRELAAKMLTKVEAMPVIPYGSKSQPATDFAGSDAEAERQFLRPINPDPVTSLAKMLTKK